LQIREKTKRIEETEKLKKVIEGRIRDLEVSLRKDKAVLNLDKLP